MCNVLVANGFVSACRWRDSLTGNIWRAVSKEDPLKKIIIKVTKDNIEPYHANNENIYTEQSVLKYLTQQQNCPKGVIQIQNFFQKNHDCYLLMEYAGISLFRFVMKMHQLVRQQKIAISHWQQISKVILTQMIEVIEYIHSKNICHFNISLESFLINDVSVDVQIAANSKQIKICLDSIQITLCDFGFSEYFDGSTSGCISSKFCGKEGYKSPEIITRKQGFDAKMNDLWALGVCFFMIVTGLAPWNSADESDAAFIYIVNYKKLLNVLHSWNIDHYVNQNIINLMESLFQYEDHRAKLSEIKQQPFFQ